jgi:hypothetical protein
METAAACDAAAVCDDYVVAEYAELHSDDVD